MYLGENLSSECVSGSIVYRDVESGVGYTDQNIKEGNRCTNICTGVFLRRPIVSDRGEKKPSCSCENNHKTWTLVK